MKAYRKTTKRHSDTLRVLAQLRKLEPDLWDVFGVFIIRSFPGRHSIEDASDDVWNPVSVAKEKDHPVKY